MAASARTRRGRVSRCRRDHLNLEGQAAALAAAMNLVSQFAIRVENVDAVSGIGIWDAFAFLKSIREQRHRCSYWSSRPLGRTGSQRPGRDPRQRAEPPRRRRETYRLGLRTRASAPKTSINRGVGYHSVAKTMPFHELNGTRGNRTVWNGVSASAGWDCLTKSIYYCSLAKSSTLTLRSIRSRLDNL